MSIFGNSIKTGIEEFPQAPLLSYGLFSDGLWVKSKEPLGTFYRKVEEVKHDLGLTKAFGDFEFEPSYEVIPKIPVGVYHALVEFYQGIFEHLQAEVFSLVFWDKEEEDFVIYVPEQIVNFASVSYQKNSGLFLDSRYVPVFESHSHSSMKSFFSGTDLKDEIASRYFAVFGQLDKNPEEIDFVVRVASNGQAKNLTLEDVFDTNLYSMKESSNYFVNLEEALTKVKKPAPVTTYKTTTTIQTYTKKAKSPYYSMYGLNDEPMYEDWDESEWYSGSSYSTTTSNGVYSLQTALSMVQYDLNRLNKARTYKPELVSNLGESITRFISECQANFPQQDAPTFLKMIEHFDEGVAEALNQEEY